MGRTDVVLRFLDAGVDIESKDGNDNTPLYYAALCGHPKTVYALLQEGARDDAYRRCYFNAQEQSVRDVMREFENAAGGGKLALKKRHAAGLIKRAEGMMGFYFDPTSSTVQRKSYNKKSDSKQRSEEKAMLNKIDIIWQECVELLSIGDPDERRSNRHRAKWRQVALASEFAYVVFSAIREYVDNPHVFLSGMRIVAALCSEPNTRRMLLDHVPAAELMQMIAKHSDNGPNERMMILQILDQFCYQSPRKFRNEAVLLVPFLCSNLREYLDFAGMVSLTFRILDLVLLGVNSESMLEFMAHDGPTLMIASFVAYFGEHPDYHVNETLAKSISRFMARYATLNQTAMGRVSNNAYRLHISENAESDTKASGADEDEPLNQRELLRSKLKENAFSDVVRYFNNPMLSDVRFAFRSDLSASSYWGNEIPDSLDVDDASQILYAHRFLLCARSPYFERLLTNPSFFEGSVAASPTSPLVIVVSDYSRECFGAYISFLYSGIRSRHLLHCLDVISPEKETKLLAAAAATHSFDEKHQSGTRALVDIETTPQYQSYIENAFDELVFGRRFSKMTESKEVFGAILDQVQSSGPGMMGDDGDDEITGLDEEEEEEEDSGSSLFNPHAVEAMQRHRMLFEQTVPLQDRLAQLLQIADCHETETLKHLIVFAIIDNALDDETAMYWLYWALRYDCPRLEIAAIRRISRAPNPIARSDAFQEYGPYFLQQCL
jgi:Ankyrin repeats (many copies)/BTB/POZ domain